MASSRKMTRGLAVTARANNKSCRWPPENAPPYSLTTVCMPMGSEFITNVIGT